MGTIKAFRRYADEDGNYPSDTDGIMDRKQKAIDYIVFKKKFEALVLKGFYFLTHCKRQKV